MSWSVINATSIRIDTGIGAVSGTSTAVSPDSNTIYTLTATNNTGTATATASVLVDRPSPLALPENTCGKIDVFNRNGRKTVLGFVGKVSDLDWIKANASGADIDVDIRPFPQCEALMALAGPLAQSDVDGLKVSIRRLPNGGDVLKTGDQLLFDVETPAYPSYLYIAYFQADGWVKNLTGLGGGLALRPPQQKLAFGIGGDWGRFTVSNKNFGREMLIVFAGKQPIFDKPVPAEETEREFLTALENALSEQGSSTQQAVSASYDAVVTAQR